MVPYTFPKNPPLPLRKGSDGRQYYFSCKNGRSAGSEKNRTLYSLITSWQMYPGLVLRIMYQPLVHISFHGLDMLDTLHLFSHLRPPASRPHFLNSQQFIFFYFLDNTVSSSYVFDLMIKHYLETAFRSSLLCPAGTVTSYCISSRAHNTFSSVVSFIFGQTARSDTG